MIAMINAQRSQDARLHTSKKSYKNVLLINPPMEVMGAEFMMEDMPIRLEYLAAYIRKHVEQVEIVDLTKESRSLKYHLKRAKPDLVGISVNYISVHNSAKELAGVAKRYGADVVVGGYQATALAEDFANDPNIDYVVRGEGEETLLELVQNHQPLQAIRGLTYRDNGHMINTQDRPLIADLDSMPFPERSRRRKAYKSPFMDLESDASTAYDMIITSRGCWGKCKFCTEPIMSHGVQRYRKPGKIIEELDEIVRLHHGNKRLRVSISDPNFGGDPRVAEELCDHLIEFKEKCRADLHFFISVRTNTIANNRNLARKMVKAGMDFVFVGMESPKIQDLKALSKGGGSQEKQEQAARFLKENGAAVMSNFLLGIPGQTQEDILGLVKYAKKLGLTDCYFSVMIPLPGSKLYEEASQNDQLLEKDYTKYRLWNMALKHDKLTAQQVRELCIRCNSKWYDDLLLKQEYGRWIQSGGKKKKLHVYSKKFKVLAGFLLFISATAQKEFHDISPSVFVRDMPNQELRRFTQEIGIHNMLEMERFLRILGDQKIQVSLLLDSDETISWVMKTSSQGVEYLDAINGTTENPTINFKIPMNNGPLKPARLVESVLKDNCSFRSRLNLVRLFAAIGSEVATCYVDGMAEKFRTITSGLLFKRNHPAS